MKHKANLGRPDSEKIERGIATSRRVNGIRWRASNLATLQGRMQVAAARRNVSGTDEAGDRSTGASSVPLN